MQPFELAKTIATVLDDKKAIDVKLLKVEALTTVADYFIVASGTSSTHVGSLAGVIEKQLSDEGVRPKAIEGAQSKEWILMDYGSVLVHIFYPDAREFYSLEHLWADAKEIDLGFEK